MRHVRQAVFGMTVETSGKGVIWVSTGERKQRNHFFRLLLLGLTLSLFAGSFSTAYAARALYVPNNGAGGNVEAFSIGAAGGLTSLGTASTGLQTTGIAITPDGKFLYATNFGADNVSGFSVGATGTLTSLGGPTSAGNGPKAVAITPDGKFLYVANCEVGSTTVSAFSINVTSGALSSLGSVTAGNQPCGLAISPDGKFIYVGNRGSASIDTFSIGSNGGLASASLPVAAGSFPYGLSITPDGKFLFVGNGDATGTVSQLTVNTTTGELSSRTTASTGAGSSPYGLSVAPNGKFVYAADQLSGKIFGFTANGALTPLDTGVFSGAGAIGLALTPNSKFLYVDNFAVGSVSGFGIDGSTGAVASLGAATSTGANPEFQPAVSPDQPPVAAFSVLLSRAGRESSFDAFDDAYRTVDPDGSVSSYTWSWGDGSSDSTTASPNITHTFSSPGTYTVTLTATDDEGCGPPSTFSFTGKMVSCNGSTVAVKSQTITVEPLGPMTTTTTTPAALEDAALLRKVKAAKNGTSISVSLECKATAGCRGKVKVQTKSKYKTGKSKKRKVIAIASKDYVLVKDAKQLLKIKLSNSVLKKLRKAVKRKRSVLLSVIVTDPAGVAVHTKSVRVKIRGKKKKK